MGNSNKPKPVLPPFLVVEEGLQILFLNLSKGIPPTLSPTTGLTLSFAKDSGHSQFGEILGLHPFHLNFSAASHQGIITPDSKIHSGKIL